MDKGMYISMTGAAQNMAAQTIHANNLANANTTGFRADLAQARSMQLFGEGHPSRVYAMTENPAASFQYGPLQETGNDLDVAVKGEGWIAVLAEDGTEAYTRAGELQVSSFGELTTGNGLPVLGNAGPIVVPPYQKIEVGIDGTLSVVEQGQGPESMTNLDRVKLVNPDVRDLEKGADGLFRRQDGAAEIPDGAVQLISGFVEGSNVNVVGAMVDMIALSRNYELNIKMIQTAEENSEMSARLLQVR